MMTTSASLRRLLLRHVPGVASADVVPRGPFHFEARVSALPGFVFDAVKLESEQLLKQFKVAGVRAEVVEAPLVETTVRDQVPARLACAAFGGSQTLAGMKRTLVLAVPALGRLLVTEDDTSGSRVVRFQVGHEDGTCSGKLVNDVKAALRAAGYAGLPFEVVPISPDNPRNDLVNAGFLLPRREKRIVLATEEDEDVFASRIRALVAGNTERLGPIDDFTGTAVFSTPNFDSAVPVHCMMALYDRVYVEMPTHKDPATYFERHFGLSAADFHEFCRIGRIWPIFKFNLGNYPDEVVRPWLERPDLPFVTPRQLDYIALRHAWISNPIVSLLRNDREAARALLKLSINLNKRYAQSGPEAVARELVGSLCDAVESFEGLAFHRGHIALGNLSPGAVAVHGLSAHADAFESKGLAQTVEMDAYSATKDIATAQAFRASLNEGMIFNWPILNVVLPYFRNAPPVSGKSAVDTLAQLVDALELSYNRSIPAGEYAEIFDQAETRRIRAITAQLLEGSGDSTLRQELREKVMSLNLEVGRLRKSALEVGEVDVVGDLGKVGGVAFGTSAVLEAITTMLGLGLAKRIASDAFEKHVEDTGLGAKLDALRGAINQVSPAAVRIYRVRSKLEAERK
jgi:hypothetical protein